MGSRIRVFWVVFSMFLLSSNSYGQTFAELFRQNKTQEKYLLKQIAYLELYSGLLRQGYNLMGSGIETIKAFSSGEFDLHKGFFGSLSLVNPLIKSDARVMEIAGMQLQIIRAFSRMVKVDLSSENMTYVHLVKAGVMEECEKDLEQLLLVISPGRLEMSDEQRLSRLAKVHSAMLEKLEFSLEFYVQVKQLEQGLKNEKLNLDRVRRLYENN